MKKAMIVVPHQDDELLVGGTALISLVRSPDWDVKVVYLTNGDSRDWEARIRMRDSMKLLCAMGMEQQNIIYMGYGNRWSGEEHLYNCASDKVLQSKAHRSETYGTGEINDYHYLKYGCHAAYTRENCKQDLRSIIGEWFPSLLIVVDLDKHEDHIALSLLFEECLGELLKENSDYTPLVLKKYAYAGAWSGKKDYWCIPHSMTLQEKDMLNPYFEWNERLQFTVPGDCNTLSIKKNYLYHLARMYRTQYVWTRVPAFANDDICFWRRHTENLALNAEITVSSGEIQSLNDFKLVDSSSIRDDHVCQFDIGKWTPLQEDRERRIEIRFPAEQSIKQIVIYENSKAESGIKKIRIQYSNSDNCEVNVQETEILPRKKNVVSVGQKQIKMIVLNILDTYGSEFGISEIEIFNEIIPIERYDLPFTQYVTESNPVLKTGNRHFLHLEEKVFRMQEKISREWFLPKYELRNQYTFLANCEYLFIIVEIYHILRKCISKLCIMIGITRRAK